MPDFNVRSDSVNVEQIMEQIRGRIREKRGVDYTEEQIRELAKVKLEKFLDPKIVRSDLLDAFRRTQPAYQPPVLPNYAFEESTLFASHRAPIRWIRRLLSPLLKMLFNPNPLIQALHIQSQLNTMYAEREATRESSRRAMDQIYYELVHNLVIETTRLGIEVKNLKMQVESQTGRLEFNERRARALESVVVYRPTDDERDAQATTPAQPSAPATSQQKYVPPPRQSPPPSAVQSSTVPGSTVPGSSVPGSTIPGSGAPGGPEGPGQRSRRRRRRRGRRGGRPATEVMAQGSEGSVQGSPLPGSEFQGSEGSEHHDDGPDQGGRDDDGGGSGDHDDQGGHGPDDSEQ